MNEHFRQAVENIGRYGDTDILPYPLEQHILYDRKDDVVELLERAYSEFFEKKEPFCPSYLDIHPPVNAGALAPVGYSGFRWATQIDPFWNTFFLGIVIALGEKIENDRIPIDEGRVYSYRHKWSNEDKTLFDQDIGWRQFMERSTELASNSPYVLVCDIADFYPRIYHHRLENALLQIAGHGEYSDHPKRINTLLSRFSATKSYGLPVGGPAARTLAEVVLNPIDKLLRMRGVEFCRFVDDYHIFAATREQAYQHLIFLTEKMLSNEGLSLQKSKTRIMSGAEFVRSSNTKFGREESDINEINTRRFLRLRIHFDPYSTAPEDQYEKIKEDLSDFDVIGMLSRELRKTRVHGALTRQLLRAIRYLNDDVTSSTAKLLVNSFDTLTPVFPQVMLLLYRVMDRLSESVRTYVHMKIQDLFLKDSYLIRIDVNRMYALRVLGKHWSQENESILAAAFENTTSALIRKDVVLIMAKWRIYPWLSDKIYSFQSYDDWVRRAFIVASYTLRDQGRHWRSHFKKSFSPFELIVRDWAAEKVNVKGWKIPI